MLKFVVDPKEPDKPALVGLGLSWENLERLRQDAIQFHSSDLGLGDGVFVIAHASDPALPTYQALVGTGVAQLIALTERTCETLRTTPEVLRVPLTHTRSGRPCEALIFAGKTEEVLLEGLKSQGALAKDAQIIRPDEPQKATTAAEPVLERTTTYRVSSFNLFKLGGGGLGFIAMTVMIAADKRGGGPQFFVTVLAAVTALVLLGMCWLRWQERIEIDAESIRRVHPFAAFSVPFSQLSAVNGRKDSLGPYEIELVTHSGRSYKLKRIYDQWDDLIRELTTSI